MLCPTASPLSRSSPTCSGINGCQPPEINSACKQRVQLDREGAASALLLTPLHAFMVVFYRYQLRCTNDIFSIPPNHYHIVFLCIFCCVLTEKPVLQMDDNLRSSPQHKPHRTDPKPSLASDKNSTPA